MKTISLVVLVALLPCLGCATLSLMGERVRVTKHESDVVACRALGAIVSRARDPVLDLRNRTAELGGDVVLFSYGFAKSTGKAYDCGGRFAAPSR